MHLRPTPSVLEIADRLERAGFEAWCVGGAIRDALLGGHPLDWDLASPATPQEVIGLFGRKRTIPVGIDFGTVTVLDDAGIAHEITTFRRDVKTDGRHAVVEFGASLDEDLARRDFTINAIAFRPKTDELRDPFGGRADIAGKLVRAVGDAGQRMREDRLRALRAIRFAARYDFAIDAATLDAIRESAPFLTRLSAERVQQELVKTMQQVRAPAAALRLWRETGALGVLVPALADASEVTLATLDRLPRDGDGGRSVPQRTSNRVAALFMDRAPHEVRDALTALRFSKHEIAWAAGMAERWHGLGEVMGRVLASGDVVSDAQVRRWLSSLGRLHAGAFLRIALARWQAGGAAHSPDGSNGVTTQHNGGAAAHRPSEAAVRSLYRRMRRAMWTDPIELADLAIGGDELRAAGVRPGPIYAKILHAMLDSVLDAPARNTPEALLEELPRVIAELERVPDSTTRP